MNIRIALALLLLPACATTFTGAAHFPDGPKGCEAKCHADGMEMGAFVYAGEYSDACVCQPKAKSASNGTEGLAAATIGVVLQMRRAQQQPNTAMH